MVGLLSTHHARLHTKFRIVSFSDGITLPSPSAQASPGSIDAGTVLDVRLASSRVPPRDLTRASMMRTRKDAEQRTSCSPCSEGLCGPPHEPAQGGLATPL